MQFELAKNAASLIDAGKPKGVLHTTGGYMVYAATTAKQ
jgi:hypothetical protein